MRIPIAGDTDSLHQILLDIHGTASAEYVVKDISANRQLSRQLIPDGRQPTPGQVASLFPSTPVSAGISFLPRGRYLSSAEKAAAMHGFAEAVQTGEFTSGPAVASFESSLSEYLRVPHIVATSSGTDALILMMKAAGIGTGDEVVIPANSYAATENAVLMCGATPVLIDVDPISFAIDPNLVPHVTTHSTKAILAVHLHGKLCDMSELARVARVHHLLLFEDACQAIGSTGVGQFSDGAALSFNPAKTLGLCGKAGALITNNEPLAKRARSIGYQGFGIGQKNYKAEPHGYNCLVDNTIASIGLRLVPYLSLNIFKRLFLAYRYSLALDNLVYQGRISLLPLSTDYSAALFPMILPSEAARDRFRTRILASRGVETELNYPLLSHQQNTWSRNKEVTRTSLPIAESLNRRTVCIPLYNGMSLVEQEYVIDAIYATLKTLA